MKGIDIFCASQAATAIYHTIEQTASPSSSALLRGGRAIDRHNPIIGDSRRKSLPPCAEDQRPTSPQKVHLKTKKKKNVASENENRTKNSDFGLKNMRMRWSCTKPAEILSPHGSTRFLLTDKTVQNDASDETEIPEVKDVKTEDLSSSESLHQVVFLRVSLDCKGCEKKLRKHLSKMEGVTSFDIDFMMKKVTIRGNMTPSEVVSRVSKIKNAQLWSSALSS